MKWEALKAAAASLGMSENSLRGKGLRGTWLRKGNKNGYLYAVPTTAEEALGANLSRWTDEVSVFTTEENPAVQTQTMPLPDHRDEKHEADELERAEKLRALQNLNGPDSFDDEAEGVERKSINGKFYIKKNGNHVFQLPHMRRPFEASSAEVDTLVDLYSNFGGKASLNICARKLNWSRKTIKAVLKMMDTTHDSFPWTDEKFMEMDEEEREQELLQRMKQQAHDRVQRVAWREIEKKAELVDDMELLIQNTAAKFMEVNPAPPVVDWRKKGAFMTSSSMADPFTAVSHASDLHYGKRGWAYEVGQEFTKEICRDRLLSATERLIERVAKWGVPEKIILGTGGDWVHFDNKEYKTTRGTLQDPDGTFLEVYMGALELTIEHIELWRSFVKDVQIVSVPGNHDEIATHTMTIALQQRYRNTDVTITRSKGSVRVGSVNASREYVQIGQTLLGLTHGDKIKDDKLGQLMSCEVPEIWGQTKHRLWLTGHWHSQRVMESYGVVVEHLPSLAGTDRWHNQHAYIGNRKALLAHLIDHEEGTIAKVFAEGAK